MENTLLIIKPDWIEKVWESNILKNIHNIWLSYSRRLSFIMQRDTIFWIWPWLYWEDFINNVMLYLLNKEVISYIINWNDSINQMLLLKKRLRDVYWIWSKKVETLIHTSDNKDDFLREDYVIQNLINNTKWKILEIL